VRLLYMLEEARPAEDLAAEVAKLRVYVAYRGSAIVTLLLGIFYFTDSTGNSAHHGLTLQATERAGKYLRLNANYTFSKVLDYGKFLVFVDTPQSNAQRNLEPFRTRIFATGSSQTSRPMRRSTASFGTSNSAVSLPCNRRGGSPCSWVLTSIWTATR